MWALNLSADVTLWDRALTLAVYQACIPDVAAAALVLFSLHNSGTSEFRWSGDVPVSQIRKIFLVLSRAIC